MTDIFLVSGLRTPFVKAGSVFAKETALSLSRPIVQAMAKRAQPDLLIWGQVIPDTSGSNIARELLVEAGLDPQIPAFSTVLACSTSFMAMVEAAGMLGTERRHLALVGGAETMSHVPITLKQEVADKITAQFRTDPAGAAAAITSLGPQDFNLPIHGWTNKQSGRSQGEHTEDTAKHFDIMRSAQDERAFLSHMAAVAGQDAGFFRDLILPVAGVEADTIPRRDSTVEKLASLPPVFDRSAGGTLTAGNSSPNTDGAAGLWVADREGLKRLDVEPTVKLVDWELAAIDFRADEGILMAPGRAIPRLLARHKLRFDDIGLWEIHEAFAAQVLANIKAASDPEYRKMRAGVDFDLGAFPWERVNPNGGSLAIGHPFAATGARIISQAVKELQDFPVGTRAIVSICADGGQGTVALLERV